MPPQYVEAEHSVTGGRLFYRFLVLEIWMAFTSVTFQL